MSELIKNVESLIKKSDSDFRGQTNSLTALQYSQAALNAAHTVHLLAEINALAANEDG